MRIALSASLIVLILSGLGTTPAPAQDFITLMPEQIGEIFCISRVGNDMAPVEGLLTGDLRTAIAEAEEKDAAWAAANPGDKPPLGDGIPWQAAPDYAATCEVGEVIYEMDRASLAIAYGFPEYPQANFTDRLELQLVAPADGTEPRWRIDNVSYASDGDLRTVLLSAFAN